ncbi:MAG: hypothetical protein ACI8WB_002578 [Phenylobacterium sp.]|jgi:hypothetical protein
MSPLIIPLAGIICTAWTIVTIYKLKHGPNNHYNDGDYDDDEESGSAKELKLEVMALKKRVEALETIITDKAYDLKQQIDKL